MANGQPSKRKRHADDDSAPSKKPRNFNPALVRPVVRSFMTVRQQIKQAQRQKKKASKKTKQELTKKQALLRSKLNQEGLKPLQQIGTIFFIVVDMYGSIEAALEHYMVKEGRWHPEDVDTDMDEEAEKATKKKTDSDSSDDSESEDDDDKEQSSNEVDQEPTNTDSQNCEDMAVEDDAQEDKEAKTATDPRRLEFISEQIKQLMPHAQAIIEELSDNVDDLLGLSRPIIHYAQSTRSNHAKKLKWDIYDLITGDREGDLEMPAHNRLDKQYRGMNHWILRQLYVPACYLAALGTNESKWMDEYRSGLYPITADMFPSFLYDDASKDFDPKNPLVNMFNSRFFIRCCNHILNGNGILNKESSNRETFAADHGITQMSPEVTAYMVIQVHFALSDADKFPRTHHQIHYPTLYNNIIETFEDPEFAKHTLDYLNERIFPKSDPRRSIGKDIVQQPPAPGTDMAIIRRQRKAHLAAAKENATPANPPTDSATITPPRHPPSPARSTLNALHVNPLQSPTQKTQSSTSEKEKPRRKKR